MEIKLRSFFSGAGVRLSSGRVSAGITSAFWLIVMARNLDQKDFGVVIIVLTLSSLTSLIHDGGQCVALSKAVVREPKLKNELFVLVLKRRIVGGLLGLLSITLLFSQTSDVAIVNILLIYPSVVATIGYTTIFSVIRTDGLVVLEAKNEVLSRIAIVIGGLLITPFGLSSIKVIFLYSLVDVLSLVIVAQKHANLFRVSRGVVKGHNAYSSISFGNSVVLALASGTGLLVARIDPIMISWLRSDTEVSSFAIGLRMVEFLLLPVGAIVVVSIPKFTRTISRQDFFQIAKPILSYGVLITICLLLGSSVLPRVFGSEYSNSINPLRILSLGTIPLAFGAVLMGWLAVRKPSYALASGLCGLAGNISAHLVLTTKFGAVGGALANITTSSIIASVAFLLFQRQNRLESSY